MRGFLAYLMGCENGYATGYYKVPTITTNYTYNPVSKTHNVFKVIRVNMKDKPHGGRNTETPRTIAHKRRSQTMGIRYGRSHTMETLWRSAIR